MSLAPKKKKVRSRSSNSSHKATNTLTRDLWSALKSIFHGVWRGYGDHRVHCILGLVLFFVFVYLLMSLYSFFSTGGIDQDIVKAGADISSQVRNRTGLGGASLSEYLFNGLFGWGSFLLIAYVGYLSIKLVWGGEDLFVSLLKRLSQALFFAFWISIVSAWLQCSLGGSNTFLQWGGNYGDRMLGYLLRMVGVWGLFLLLMGSLLIVLVILSDRVLYVVQTPRLVQLPRWSLGAKIKSMFARLSSRDGEAESDEENEEFESSDTDSSSDCILEFSRDEYVEEDDVDSALPDITSQEDSPISVPEQPVFSQQAQQSTLDEEPTLQGGSTSFVIERAPEDDQVTETESSEALPPGILFPNYKKPPLELLLEHGGGKQEVDCEEVDNLGQQIARVLDDYKIRVQFVKATVGPTVTLYEVIPDPGVKLSRIKAMEDDVALHLKSGGVRIIAPMPGKGTVGIEVPNSKPEIVSMRSILSSRRYHDQMVSMELPVGIGKTITNEPFVFDLAKTPHLLIAGATGQGKSVGLNALITSLLYSKRPEQLKFVLVDPKMLEFSVYASIERHFLAKLPEEEHAIITDMSRVVPTLNSLCIEMDSRYQRLMSARVKNIKEYNAKVLSGVLSRAQGYELMPYIVVIVDEFADLIATSGKEVESPIARLAQKARAAGIHVVIATQRPSTDVITGLIKANFPARIAFKVFSMVDSRTILDSPGANQLVGRGDMLFYQGQEMIRLQCGFMDTPESEAIVDHISLQEGAANTYELPPAPEEDTETKSFNPHEKDALFEEVARLIVQTQVGSTSNIQRKFNIGYNRAGRLMDQLEGAGIVGPQSGSKTREVYIKDVMSLEHLLSTLR